MVNSRTPAWALVSIFAAAFMAGSAGVAVAQDLKIGVVDVERVYKDAPRVKQYTETLNVTKQALGAKLDIRQQNMMLDENEIRELLDLKIKDNPTDKDKARITELGDADRARDGELKKLNETKDLTDAQKTRQKTLADGLQKSKDTIAALAKDYDGELSSKMTDLNTKAEADVREAIKAVATAKSLTMVVAKDAVLFGGTDVTDDIIAKLDRKVQ